MSDVPVPTEDPTPFTFLQERASQFQQTANDARGLIKTNLLIVGLFLPIVGSLFSGQLSPSKVFNNAYTQVGLFVWVLSTLLLIFTYHRARTTAISHFDPVEAELLGHIPDDERIYQVQDIIAEHSNSVGNLNRFVTVCTGLSLVATTLFALGVLLPYVAVIPQFGTLVVIGSIIGLVLLLILAYKLFEHIPHPNQLISQDGNAWEDLTQPRQDLLKKIYVAVGDGDFQLSDLPMKHSGPRLSGTLSSEQLDESHVLLQDVFDTDISEYLLEQLVDEGYFKKTGESDSTKIRSPHSLEEFSIIDVGGEVETAIDRLGRELEHNDEARETAASELNLRPSELLDELRSGDGLDRIERYNRVIDRLEDDEFDISARPFEFTSDKVTYKPTKLAEKAYERLKMEEQDREYRREMAKRDEEIRKAENTYNFEVVEPADEHGEMQVVSHDISATGMGHKWLNIHEADVSEADLNRLRNLDSGDQIELRVEHHPLHQSGDEYIASVGGP